MCIKNRIFALAFRVIMLTGCGVALTISLGITQGQFDWVALNYYTNLSNLICFIFFLFLTGKTIIELKRDGANGTTTLMPHLKGAFVMMIAITLLVFHFMLSGAITLPADPWSQFNIANTLLHYVTPILVILDWFLFDKKNTYRWSEPLLWLASPLAYLGFFMIRAEIVGNMPGRQTRYPYPFLDVDVLGWSSVVLLIAIMSAAFIAIGYLFFLIDKVHLKNGKLRVGSRN
jgi:hypothetical protein